MGVGVGVSAATDGAAAGDEMTVGDVILLGGRVAPGVTVGAVGPGAGDAPACISLRVAVTRMEALAHRRGRQRHKANRVECLEAMFDEEGRMSRGPRFQQEMKSASECRRGNEITRASSSTLLSGHGCPGNQSSEGPHRMYAQELFTARKARPVRCPFEFESKRDVNYANFFGLNVHNSGLVRL